ncbi:MAG: serine hydrolase domain-containing protein [Alphaproteobacteria bacterium]
MLIRGLVTAFLTIGLALPVLSADLPRGTPEDVGMSSERLSRLDAALENHVQQGRVAGVVSLVARQGKVVHFDAVGHADIETDHLMTRDTMFRIASMTKPVTSVAVMMLFEEGHFLLSDPVSKYIPELKDLQVYVSGEGDAIVTRPAAREMTIRDLLTHQSGFIYGGVISTGPVADLYDQKGATVGASRPKTAPPLNSLADLTRILSTLPLAHDPGAQWSYGVSTDVLGRLIEVVSGMPLDQFFQERVFGPLGMRDTAFWVPLDKQPRFAAVYTFNEQGQLTPMLGPDEARFASPPPAPSGGGGLVSTANDYAKFCQMLLNGGSFGGVRLLGPKTIKLMTMNHLQEEGARLPAFPGASFGLGFAVIEDVAMTQVMGSEGEYSWAGFFSTDFWIDPEEDLFGIVLTQTVPYGSNPLRTEAKRFVYQSIID